MLNNPVRVNRTLGGLLCARPHSGHHEVRLGGFPPRRTRAEPMHVCVRAAGDLACREYRHVWFWGFLGIFWLPVKSLLGSPLGALVRFTAVQLCRATRGAGHGGRDGAGESAARSRLQSRMKRADWPSPRRLPCRNVPAADLGSGDPFRKTTASGGAVACRGV